MPDMNAQSSTRRLEYPHSLSYHETIFTKLLFSEIPALMSTTDEVFSPTKSVETTSSSTYPRTPFMGPSASALIAATMSSIDAPFSMRHVRSTTETSGVGTRNAIPVSLPFSSGITLPTAFAAPVAEGMMFWEAQRPPRQSFPPREGPSTVSCVAVIACTVVISPSVIPNSSWITFASGARQLVVQEAFETTVRSLVYFSLFTPITNIGASADGAEITTFFAPPFKCNAAFSWPVKTPVDSQT